MPAVTSTTPTTKSPSPRKKGLKKKVPKRDAANSASPRSSTKQSQYEEELAFEGTISRILLRRFEHDIARLFSTHIHRLAENQLPRLIMSVLQIAPPGWVALNANGEEVKDFFRGALALDIRQAGERVATKSVLWSYTAIRHFAVSHDVPICGHRSLHSHLLLPYHAQMRAHLQTLESPHPPVLTKPPYLGPLNKGYKALERYCLSRVKNTPMGNFPPEWQDWRTKVREGYDRMVETLWEVANELDVRGYGLVLREKLSDKWCCLSCLGTVCEPTAQTGEDGKETSSAAPIPSSKGKEREWDGRGAGVYRWDTPDEEDMWNAKLDFGGAPSDYLDLYLEEDEDEDVLSVGELMELRYIKAEREKELGNAAFKKANYEVAIKHYENAYRIEPEIPHYQLNLAAAYLKVHNWKEAEAACTIALGQQKSSKAYYRRAKARKMLGRIDQAEQDLLAILAFQSSNADAITELQNLHPPEPTDPYPSPPASPHAAYSSPASCSHKPVNVGLPSPRKFRAGEGLPLKLNERPIPWEIHQRDHAKLKIHFLPLTIQIDPHYGTETFSYPSWDRYQVSKA